MNPNHSLNLSATVKHSALPQNAQLSPVIKVKQLSALSGLLIIAIATALSGCVLPHHPEEADICDNIEDDMTQCHFYDNDTPYMRSKTSERAPKNITQRANNPMGTTWLMQTGQAQQALHLPQNIRLSVGDRLNVNVLNGLEFSGKVEVNNDGYIYLPYLQPVHAKGLDVQQLSTSIAQHLVEQDFMLKDSVRISITPLKWAPVQVTVSGGVFEPGQHKINKKTDTVIIDDSGSHSGDQAVERSIAAALRASGGVRPDANISEIIVIRDQHSFKLDLSGVIHGYPVPSMTLMSGDHIHVPQHDYFDDALARPSQITAPGIRVFLSNLTQPASSNSQSAVDTDATRFPYGTRLLSGAIAANCVGGAQSTNASRHLLLITKNPLTSEMDVIERSMDSLIRHSWETGMNPILMPGDGIACYDSRVTNMREIARTITEILVPATLLELL
ncbi:polysaccharide biosynthesis/export family protein [Shewanella gelidimarina]|uniref:polysaccharide biosynthesis/export family protein n=1 Tax=Shewanella gelidimarina TaxID=56813 RepID=UPI00201012F7|nr:polysaccharide biosynthesis/export family protein [Shewanella gelidimarina]MCL1057906.1 polysaccharide biosynthesis/export family protein [Shewanella gelidimarina]